MTAMIHDTFNNASTSLHATFNDNKPNVDYIYDMDVKIESGKRIKRIREGKSLFLRDVCAMVNGLSVARLSNYEQGIRMVPVDQAKKIAAALDTSPEYILTLIDHDLDPKEKKLIQVFRECDQRGKLAIVRMAEQERIISNNGGADITEHHYAGPERRKDRH